MLFSAHTRLLITVPLLALPLVALPLHHAVAAGGAAAEAVRILSKAKSADARCNYLSGSERAELSRYAARAEIAAASQSGPRAARSAAAAGAAEGGNAACSQELNADVRETLSAAREAVASARAEPAPPRKAKARTKAQVRAAGHRSKAASAGLSRYERLVGAYYLETECRSLSKGEAKRFWSAIARLHKDTIAANGVAAVAPLKRSAERRARGSSCGNRALAEIREGFEETLSR